MQQLSAQGQQFIQDLAQRYGVSTDAAITMLYAVMIKGLGVGAIWKELLILNGMLVFFLGLAIKKFKIRLA